MKKIFVMAALSLAAISCTKSDVLDSPVLEQPINFSTYLGRTPITKASVQSTETMKGIGFNVKAFECTKSVGENDAVTYAWATDTEAKTHSYMNVKLTKGAEASGWSYVEADGENKGDALAYYWPTNANQLVFASYGLNVHPEVVNDENEFAGFSDKYITFKSGSLTDFTYTVPTDIAQQQDLLAASTGAYNQDTPSLGEDEDGGVKLVYKHLLSRIEFVLTSNGGLSDNPNTDAKESDCLPIKIKSLGLKGKFITTADYSLVSIKEGALQGVTPTYPDAPEDFITYNIISNAGDASKDYYSQNGVELKLYNTGVEENNRYMMIIPQEVDDVTIEVSYTIDNDPTPRIVSLPIKSDKLTSFVAGYAYKFILNVKTSMISFVVDETPWDETWNDTATNGKFDI